MLRNTRKAIILGLDYTFVPRRPSRRPLSDEDGHAYGCAACKACDGQGRCLRDCLPRRVYTDFGSHLAANMSVIDEIAAQGFAMVRISRSVVACFSSV